MRGEERTLRTESSDGAPHAPPPERSGLGSEAERLEARDAGAGLVAAADSLLDALDAAEKELVNPRIVVRNDAFQFPSGLDGQLASLYGVVVGTFDAPTEGARARWDDLLPTWAHARERVRRVLDQEVAAFNGRLETAGYGPVPAPLP